MTRTPRPLALLTILPLAAALVAPAKGPAQSTPRRSDALADDLARLRTEVDALSTRLESQGSDGRTRLQALARQRTELDAQLRRETVRVAELRRRLDDWKQKIAARSARREVLKPVVTTGAAALRAAMTQSMPFERESRLRELDQLVDQLTRGLLTPDDAVARLWDRVEDELRLGRENALHSQVIRLQGKEHLVEVVRLGMILMYFRTKDGRYGLAERQGAGWGWRLLHGGAAKQRIDAVFESFRRQMRTGFFTLPGGLPASTGGAR
jgi:hypothetical protein